MVLDHEGALETHLVRIADVLDELAIAVAVAQGIELADLATAKQSELHGFLLQEKSE